MKKILFFVFALFSFSLNAQVVASMTPELIEKTATVDLTNLNLIVKANGQLSNLSSTSQSFKWTIEEVDAPEEWEFQLCDKNQCFAFDVVSNVDSTIGLNIPLFIESNTISIMDLSVKPSGVAGIGTYKVSVATIDNPDSVLTSATYVFNLSGTTSTNNFKKSSVKLFPNPTVNYFTLTENPYVKEVQVFNIVGKQMLFTPYQNGTAINVSSFPNGLYLVRMLDEDGEILKTTRLTKR